MALIVPYLPLNPLLPRPKGDEDAEEMKKQIPSNQSINNNIIFSSEVHLMAVASYLFTGKFALSDQSESESRIRVIAVSGNQSASDVGLFECPCPGGDWEFILSQRLPLNCVACIIIAETCQENGEWIEAARFDRQVDFWPRERWAWIYRGTRRYLGKFYRVVFRELRRFFHRSRRAFYKVFRIVPSDHGLEIEKAWNRYRALSSSLTGGDIWKNQLSSFEKELLWSRIRTRRETLGNLHQYPPRKPIYDDFPGEIPGNRSALKITIVTPSYQQGQYLPLAMESVSGLSAENIDHIVMDGGSSDGSVAAIREREAGLKFWHSGPDKGQSDAIRTGFLKMDCGDQDIMAYLNSDDVYCPGTIPFVLRIFERRPDLDVLYGHRIVINQSGLEVGRWVLPPHDPEILQLVDYVPQETVFWRRRIYDKVDGIDPSFMFAIDWDLLLRFQKAGAIIERVPWFLSCFRVHQSQKTQMLLEDVGREEMRWLRIRENGGELPPAEKINEAVRRARIESAYFTEQLGEGNRI